MVENPQALGVVLRDRAELSTMDRLQSKPIVSTTNAETFKLIQQQIAPNCTNAEVGHYLELCVAYELDPFAREAWCAKSKSGQLLIIVGRDGLRKIAQRNGLHVDGDVVRENDEFTICRTPDGNRTVAHSYGSPAKRGEIIGAYAEVRQGGPLGKPMGYFFAPIEEYRPTNASSYSPWSKQVGVMILAAAERQAIRQATPLSGLIASGEEYLIDENSAPALTDGSGSGEARGIDLGPEVEAVMVRAERLGHQGYANRASIEMAIGGVGEDRVRAWVEAATCSLDEFEARQPKEAEVVEAEVVQPDASSRPSSGAVTPSEAVPVPEPAPVAQEAGESVVDLGALRRRLAELLDRRDALDPNEADPEDAADLDERIELVENELRSAGGDVPGQGGLFDA